MNQPRYEVADVFRQYGEAYCRKYSLSPEQLAVFNLIKICRTSVLGGHLEKCDHCSFERPAYNSCRNRHCPKCQSLAKEKWLNDRRSELLPVGYFHLVFTLPHLLNPLIVCNKKI
ncbi:MAG: transposase zinc-binding domain-containing protein, partial [Desulfobacterales bacterium]|nr:transposase zinc-binding domain-containing protein [Desulfobacterales bacterium]